MRCPYCEYKNSKVLDSRSSGDGGVIRRRRECLSCMRRFTTREFVEEVPLMVIKDDGRREPFNREKIQSGIWLACKKRPVAVQQVQELVDEIEHAIRGRQTYEMPSNEIGQMVMRALRDIDEVAYVRFASVYRKFQDKEEFITELRDLGKRGA